MFRDMFEIAQEDAVGKPGGTAVNPIPTGDSAGAFSDFLWAIRVRPRELTQFLKSDSSPAKAVKLINIACLSHKYQDSDLSDWALEQLYETLKPTPPAFSLSGPVLTPLLSTLALFNESDNGVKSLIALLRQRIEESMTAAAQNPIDMIGLVYACSASGCTSLLPMAYYSLLVSPRYPLWPFDGRLGEAQIYLNDQPRSAKYRVYVKLCRRFHGRFTVRSRIQRRQRMDRKHCGAHDQVIRG
ncbi:hypothetical protein AURDEDRAFT_116620 [Auricularia subglabra TFB-10046 SS5]|nr:hypothetical protein AURDEDRAFT_116620 [Auricularia subglabra TFB-10046 SS5]